MILGIIVASDRCSIGKMRDLSGIAIKKIIRSNFTISKTYYIILPDDPKKIYIEIVKMADKKHCDLILTTGGTGLSKRDSTPEATLKAVTKVVPGISEIMRVNTFKKSPFAILSRGISGIRGNTLIINLPGSPKAIKECLSIIIPVLNHGIEIIQGRSKQG